MISIVIISFNEEEWIHRILKNLRAIIPNSMSTAAKIANGDVLFFIHADMTLATIVQKIDSEKYDGGGFANIFDEDNDRIKRLGKILNFRIFDKREQSDKGIFYGDNGIFVRKAVFETLGGFKEIPIIEDYEFSKKLSSRYQTVKIYHPLITVSARRHQKAGFFKTRLQWVLSLNLLLIFLNCYLKNVSKNFI